MTPLQLAFAGIDDPRRDELSAGDIEAAEAIAAEQAETLKRERGTARRCRCDRPWPSSGGCLKCGRVIA